MVVPAKGRLLLNLLGLFPLEIISQTNYGRNSCSDRTERHPYQQIVWMPQGRQSHYCRILGMQAQEDPLDYRAMQSRNWGYWIRWTPDRLKTSQSIVRFEPVDVQRFSGNEGGEA